MANHIIAGSVRADWSQVNQTWIVRPHNPNWSEEVRDRAPILRVLNSDNEVMDYLFEYGGFDCIDEFFEYVKIIEPPSSNKISKPFIDGEMYLVSGELLNEKYEFIRQLHDRDKSESALIGLSGNIVKIEANAERMSDYLEAIWPLLQSILGKVEP